MFCQTLLNIMAFLLIKPLFEKKNISKGWTQIQFESFFIAKLKDESTTDSTIAVTQNFSKILRHRFFGKRKS